MVIIIFFIVHWYFSLFFQSFLNHRYAAHQMFTMSTFWERTFQFLSWLGNGSSYLSPYAYGAMHRMHHAFADTEKDPHSPKYSSNLFTLMTGTQKIYSDIYRGRMKLEDRFLKNLPRWKAFDTFGESWITRLLWVGAYFTLYWFFATAWWMWILFPITVVMGPFHGVIINWFAHKIGYRNFEVNDTSMNLMPFDIFMLGEGYHNNHHKRGSNPNFGYKWYEWDPVYPFILFFNAIGIIKLKKTSPSTSTSKYRIQFTANDRARIKSAFTNNGLSIKGIKFPEKTFKSAVESWESVVKRNWRGDLNEYLKSLKARDELQVYLESVSESTRKKLNKWIAPLDKAFKEKMKGWDPKLIGGKEGLGEGKHFWQTHSIFAAG